MKEKIVTLFFLFFCIYSLTEAKAQEVTRGRLDVYSDFQSKLVTPRDIYVWLPDNYSPQKSYAVLYMHDGQMLFDSKTTWNKQAWNVDEVSGTLQDKGKIKEYIIVGIENIPNERFYNYFPQKTLNFLESNDPVFRTTNGGKPALERKAFNADNYLKFIVTEVKPFIDQKYSVKRDFGNTFIMGSSMGGLISLYALCEYPQVFGGAAALSMHTPMLTGSDFSEHDYNRWAGAFRRYLEKNLPQTNSRLIYIDYGNKTLDSLYQPFQSKIDLLLRNKGWNSSHWLTKFFPGAAHTEKDWHKRLNNPIQFLLMSDNNSTIEKIEPAFWWAGMKNSELQLMVYGDNISLYTPSIENKKIKITRVERLDSPNYLFVYLNIDKATAGKFDILFNRNGHKIKYEYELKRRVEHATEKVGFNSSDIVYLLMPDRFANGNTANDTIKMRYPYTFDRKNMNARHGGDIAGVKKEINYLNELGITAVWMTPFLENDMGEFSYHGYAITDYYKVDPRLGSLEEYKDLVEKMHEKGIKVIMDMVFNHCGSKHQWCKDTPSADWFNNPDHYVETNHNKNVFFDPYASNVDYKLMTDGWFVPTMPDLNQRNEHLAKYLIQNSIWWIEYADLNGIRQDTYPYSNKEMMAEWCKRVLEEYPQLNIVGEIMVANSLSTSYWQQGSKNNQSQTYLKSVMDFGLSEIASKAFLEETSWNSGLQKIHEHLSYDFSYPDINNVLRLYENHDMDRFLKETPADLSGFKKAITFLLTIPGIPQLYYGQEQLFSGSAKIDYGYIRPDMLGGWTEDPRTVFEQSGRTPMQQEAFAFVSKLANWRKGNPIIAKGSMKHFQVRNGVYVYERALDGKNVIVILNGTQKQVQLPLEHYKEVMDQTKQYRDVISNSIISLQEKLEIPSNGIYLLESIQ